MRLLEWFRGLLETPVSQGAREWSEAADRWRAINDEARSKPCSCGKPATHVRRHYGTIGGVPYEQWGCADHFDADMGSGPRYGYDRISQCDGCGVDRHCLGHGGKIGGPTEHWSCPVRCAPEDRHDGGWVNGQ